MVDARGPTERTGVDQQPGRGNSVLPIALGGLVLVLVVALVLALLLWRDDDAVTGSQNTTVGAIMEEPESFIGENVTVSGEVSQVLTPFSYIIGGEQFVGGSELLIIGPPPAVSSTPIADQEVYPQDVVQISGEVREFDRAAFEQELNVDLPADVFDQYAGEPVVVGGTTAITSRVRVAEAEVVDVGEILESADEFTGEEVTVTDEITTVINEQTFVLGDGLIVINQTEVVAGTAFVEGGNVQASGEVQPFDSADIDAESLSQFEGNPVLIANIIQILDAP